MSAHETGRRPPSARGRALFLRLLPFAAVCVLAFALPLPSLVHAQPALPKAPAGVPSALPKVPAGVPSAVPSAPPLTAPSAIPSALPKAPALPGAPKKAGAAPAAGAPPAAEGASAAAPPDDEGDGSDDVDVILKDEKPKAADDGLPATLPRELRANAPAGANLQVQDRKEGGLTIEEIVNSPVKSASNRLEGSLSAPAYVLVLTAKDLRDRGYTELSQALDDLPGMDVVRPFGDVYVKSYWRGYRSSGADPYLVMVDGVLFDHLFYGDTQILATFPITNIERIEVVYGPASALYGPNAAMGIINVVTADGRDRQLAGELGARLESRVTFGGPQGNLGRFLDYTKIVDATASYTTKDFRLRLTTRIEDGVLDRSIADRFEYTKNTYYADPRIWGQNVLDAYPNLAGAFRSPDQKRAVDARLFLGNFELAAQYFTLSTGFGTRYAADQFQTQTPWTTAEMSVYGRHSANLSPSVASTTLIQYRRSSIAAPSSFFGRSQSTPGTFADAGPSFTAVEAPNSAVTLQQDLNIEAARNLFMDRDEVTLGTGIKYQHLQLSKEYQVTSQLLYPVDLPVSQATNLSDASSVTNDGRYMLPADQLGVYALAKYAFPEKNAIHLGMRVDSLRFSDSPDLTFRGGYVGTFDALTVKLLYGQAVYKPSPYDLSAITTPLKPEHSQTLEANVGFTFWKIALNADAYFVDYANPIIDGKNLDKRNIVGADFGARLLLRPLQIWAHYSRYILAKESDSATGEMHRIGDLAFDKVWAGATFDKGPFTATLLARIMGPRDPVLTNPLGTVPMYAVIDANVRLSHVIFDGLWLAFRVSNLLDAKYTQPGMGTAGSGDTPGVWNGASYTGSKDFYNSRLPQPGRGLYLTLGLEL